MEIKLGNLSIAQIEKRAGVEFPIELIEFMNLTHQSDANNIKSGKWHCFDIPFMLVCGDMETATKIYSYLKDQSSKFKEVLQIGIENN